MTVLVTGATGLVGNNVTRILVDQGRKVRVLVREEAESRPLEGLDVEIANGDVRDADSVNKAFDGVSSVIHAAGMVHIGWSQIEQHQAVNVGGTKNVANAAIAAGAKMVHVSSVDALGLGDRDQPADEQSARQGNTPCGYVVTKTAAEQAVQEAIERGLFATIVNPGFMLGPWDWKPSSGRMLLEVAKTFTPLAPVGGMTLCHVNDVAIGIISALDNGQCGRNYILGGHLISYFDSWKLFADVTGGRPPTWRVGPVLRWIAGTVCDAAGKIRGREFDVNSASIEMSRLFHYFSSARAEAELDYKISPVRSCVEDAWSWFREHGYV